MVTAFLFVILGLFIVVTGITFFARMNADEDEGVAFLIGLFMGFLILGTSCALYIQLFPHVCEAITGG